LNGWFIGWLEYERMVGKKDCWLAGWFDSIKVGWLDGLIEG